MVETPNNTHVLLIRTSHVCHRPRAAGRNQQVEEYKHTHTHTHPPPHTHTHTHAHAITILNSLSRHSTKEQALKIFEKSKKKASLWGSTVNI